MYYPIKPTKEDVTHYLHLISTIDTLCEHYGLIQPTHNGKKKSYNLVETHRKHSL